MISNSSFNSIFTADVRKKIYKETIVPYSNNTTHTDFLNMLEDLYNDIVTCKYSPATPREYLFQPKTELVPRIIPVFEAKDECCYYFVCKMLEDEIADNRINGTFGGWRLGNKLRTLEEDELLYTYRSYNPYMWTEYWKEYQKLSNHYSKQGYKYIVKLDIANFYDNINLGILESKLFLATKKDKWEYINILMYILRYWNKKIDTYNPKNVGIPQCEFGDQSRVLANFYLQDYDEKIKLICDRLNSEYIRYADDQTVFCNSLDDVKNIMYRIALELNKLGLNLNASKVEIFNSEDFSRYWGFEIMSLLDKNSKESVNQAMKNFITCIENKEKFRSDIILRRIINKHIYQLDLGYKFEILKQITSKNFIINNSSRYLAKSYDVLSLEEKEKYIQTVNEVSAETYFNSNLYEIENFYKKSKIPYDEKWYHNKIQNLRL